VPAERVTLICTGEHAGIARRILAAVADGAPDDAGAVFVRTWQREARPYVGDGWCFAMMDRLARAAHPLLRVEPADQPVDRFTRLWLTDTGARVIPAWRRTPCWTPGGPVTGCGS
jgi:hypothetical protein